MLHTLLHMMSMQKYVKLYSCVSISPVVPGNGNGEEVTGEGKIRGILLLMNTFRLCSMLRQD